MTSTRLDDVSGPRVDLSIVSFDVQRNHVHCVIEVTASFSQDDIVLISAFRFVPRGRLELAMLMALVLICSVAAMPDLRHCSRDNATAVIRVPADFANPLTCLMHGQAYLAESAIGQELDGTDRVKVVCARNEAVDARLTVK
jgi:hypothetical protein